MKRHLVFAFAFALMSVSARAQTPRDDAVEQVEALFVSSSVLTPDSPFLQSLMQPAIKANAGVAPEEWATVAKEVAQAVSQVFSARGGPLDIAFKSSVRELSDDELAQLARLLNDPVYRKFQHATANPETQRQILQAVMASAMNMQSAINAVLLRHGLNAVH